MASQLVGFNYDCLEPEVRARAAENSARIRELVRGTTAAIVEIGKRLLEIHDALGKRYYQAWLRAEFGWSQCCASRFESVARRFADATCIDHFQSSALYLLSRNSTDRRAIQEAIRRAESGEIITRVVALRLIQKHLPAAGHERQNAPTELKIARYNLRGNLRRALRIASPQERQDIAEELSKIVNEIRSGLLTFDEAG